MHWSKPVESAVSSPKPNLKPRRLPADESTPLISPNMVRNPSLTVWSFVCYAGSFACSSCCCYCQTQAAHSCLNHPGGPKLWTNVPLCESDEVNCDARPYDLEVFGTNWQDFSRQVCVSCDVSSPPHLMSSPLKSSVCDITALLTGVC